ncbi:DNA sulfur modification protein DndB [Sporosarcina trichiuri]|uniref:DNA sulfur modification protein DndB n=1 Tax=Sporosarcina trichiuri TaxID=3056445 RepID=UPI0025B4C38E|nr:DNA sulfur modification protein DndB [Sporosarcina sp. 0.2-SM1T-5]WJY26382.1 DNA sulfur modification protein DndB [Sporosarcina sp. 0.2-SM1T-5]
MLTAEIFDKRQSVTVYRLEELIDRLEDGRITVREPAKQQVTLIRRYMLDNLAGGHVYFPPIVGHIPWEDGREGRPDGFAVIDGTQRLRAIGQLRTFINRMLGSDDPEEHAKGYLMNKMLGSIEIAVQLFEGFTEEESDQLYIDLNTKGKAVSLSKRISYDSRNDLNRTTNLLVKTHKGLQRAGIELEKRSVRRPGNLNLLSLSQLRQLVGYFLTGKGFHAKPDLQKPLGTDETANLTVIGLWLDELFALVPAEHIGDYSQSMLANFTLLSAVAEYAFDGLHALPAEKRQEKIRARMQGLAGIDWNARHSQWRDFSGETRRGHYYFDKNKATYDALVAWLRLKGGE